MARNVEIKARMRDAARVRGRALALADGPPELIFQADTFFAVPSGRLKLRAFADGRGELICYERPDASGPKTSRYGIAPVADAAALLAVLTAALPRSGVVRKERELLLAGRTRIHVDRVEGLGEFLELEVVLAEGEDAATGEAEARDLLQRLGIGDDDLVSGAYIDLLAARS